MTPEAQGAVERAAEVLAGVEAIDRYAQGKAIAAHARGDNEEERRWLDLLINTGRLLDLLATPPTASHDETALTEAVEVEWFNGNIAEDVRDRLLTAARAAAGDAGMAGESGGTS